MGVIDGVWVGFKVGKIVGVWVGFKVGKIDGGWVGFKVGKIGESDGECVGPLVGVLV